MTMHKDVLTLWYYEQDNSWTDCNGFIVLDLFRYVTPGYIDIFRAGHSNMVVPRRDCPGEAVMLFYENLESEDDDDFKIYI